MEVTFSVSDNAMRTLARYVAEELRAGQNVQQPMMTMREKRSRRLDIGQTAAYMNRSRSTIDRWRKNKPEFKMLEHIDGTSTYFLTNELDEYLNQ
ncbi:helix-turn-helix transcriptional regulator [Ligilactobacillus apodemi]|uniref:helix-turn-helix transcriptional regulator n=1 Tax=Ligilactobacillus apodemi TaxID=307126 RepID=UPI00046834E5|nr:hypothetical protein [Ligilactobacillus apodemi]